MTNQGFFSSVLSVICKKEAVFFEVKFVKKVVAFPHFLLRSHPLKSL